MFLVAVFFVCLIQNGKIYLAPIVLSRCLSSENLCGRCQLSYEVIAWLYRDASGEWLAEYVKVCRLCQVQPNRSEVFVVFFAKMVADGSVFRAPLDWEFFVWLGSRLYLGNPLGKLMQDWPNTLNARPDAFYCGVFINGFTIINE